MSIGDLVSGIGILLLLTGYGYWIWFHCQKSRIAVLRSKSRWHHLGNLTVVGMMVFAAGRVLAKMR